MSNPDTTLDFPTIEDIARYCGDGTAQALEMERPVKPACPLCGMTGWHRDSCPTKKEQS